MRTINAGYKLATLLFLVVMSVMSHASAPDSASSETVLTKADGLAVALRATMNHNPTIKGKKAELNAQEYGIDSAEAKRYPTLSAQANTVSEDYNQGTLRLDQPLWAFGKIDTAIDQAKASFDAEQWDLLAVQRQLIEDTSVVYAKIDGIKSREKIAQTNIDEHERLHQSIERRQKGQLASEADVRLAYSRVLQARAKKQKIQGEWLVADTELKALTQIQVPTDISVDPRLAELPSFKDVERLAIEMSADIRFKHLRLAVVKLEVKTEKLASMPTLFLRVEQDVWDRSPNIDSTRTGLAFETSFEGLGLVTLGRVKGAEANLQAAEFDVDASIIDVRRKVKTLMLNRRVQNGLMGVQRLSVAAVEETMASFLRQYKTGRKSWVEVLNTQRELTELRLLLAQIENDWLTLSLRLVSMIGGLDQQAGLYAYDK